MKKQLLIIVFATALAYLNIFNNQPAVDDHLFLGKYHPSLTEAFLGAVPPGHEGVYRPIRGIFYTIYYQLWGANPFGYHLNSLLVHLAATILVFFIVHELAYINSKSKIRSSKQIQNSNDQNSKRFEFKILSLVPFLTALLFGLHPVHTETITYMASAMESIGIVFFLLAFYLYLRSRNPYRINKFGMTTSVIFALLAFFTTEMTLTLPLLLVLYEATLGKFGQLAKRVWPYFAGALAYGAVRIFLIHATTRGPYLANSFYLTMLTMTKVLIHYLWVLIWPVNLTSNHIISPGIEAFVYRNYQTAAIASQSIFDLEILVSLFVLLVLLVLLVKLRKTQPLVSFSIGWFFLGLLPVMELVPQGSMMNEKSLYLSSLGFILLLAFVFVKLVQLDKFAKFALAGLFILAIFYGARTVARNADWQSDITLWQADVRQSPDQNAYARFALGNAYNDRKDYQKAIDQYAKSVEINPGFSVGWASLGRTYADLGKIPEAIANYKQALTIDPNFWEVKNNLNNIYKQL